MRKKQAGVRSPWAIVTYPLRVVGRTLSIALTALFIGLAAAFGGRIRIEKPLPENRATDVIKKDV
ncbi:MAG TPA: hypothetical protein VH877_10915 [Polyangia bacterium]|jgi:hypothetical protein|nr:hypothetical protein [Polyangia bacterium]